VAQRRHQAVHSYSGQLDFKEFVGLYTEEKNMKAAQIKAWAFDCFCRAGHVLMQIPANTGQHHRHRADAESDFGGAVNRFIHRANIANCLKAGFYLN